MYADCEGDYFQDASNYNQGRPVGTCETICPLSEALERLENGTIDMFELSSIIERECRNLGDNFHERFKMCGHYFVKRYSRSSAEQPVPSPETLRTEMTLETTMQYLILHVMPQVDFSQDKLPPADYAGKWYFFLWDRFRAIKKDINQQGLVSYKVVTIVRAMTLFHIFCQFLLNDYPPEVFDKKMNYSFINDCLQMHQYLITSLCERGEYDYLNNPEEFETMAQFLAFELLMNIDSPQLSNILLKGLHMGVIVAPLLSNIMCLFASTAQGNIQQYQLLFNKLPPLHRCLLKQDIDALKVTALAAFMKLFSPTGIAPDELGLYVANYFKLKCNTPENRDFLNKLTDIVDTQENGQLSFLRLRDLIEQGDAGKFFSTTIRNYNDIYKNFADYFQHATCFMDRRMFFIKVVTNNFNMEVTNYDREDTAIEFDSEEKFQIAYQVGSDFLAQVGYLEPQKNLLQTETFKQPLRQIGSIYSAQPAFNFNNTQNELFNVVTEKNVPAMSFLDATQNSSVNLTESAAEATTFLPVINQKMEDTKVSFLPLSQKVENTETTFLPVLSQKVENTETTFLPVLNQKTENTETTFLPVLNQKTEKTETTFLPVLNQKTEKTETTLPPLLSENTEKTETTLPPIISLKKVEKTNQIDTSTTLQDAEETSDTLIEILTPDVEKPPEPFSSNILEEGKKRRLAAIEEEMREQDVLKERLHFPNDEMEKLYRRRRLEETFSKIRSHMLEQASHLPAPVPVNKRRRAQKKTRVSVDDYGICTHTPKKRTYSDDTDTRKVQKKSLKNYHSSYENKEKLFYVHWLVQTRVFTKDKLDEIVANDFTTFHDTKIPEGTYFDQMKPTMHLLYDLNKRFYTDIFQFLKHHLKGVEKHGNKPFSSNPEQIFRTVFDCYYFIEYFFVDVYYLSWKFNNFIDSAVFKGLVTESEEHHHINSALFVFSKEAFSYDGIFYKRIDGDHFFGRKTRGRFLSKSSPVVTLKRPEFEYMMYLQLFKFLFIESDKNFDETKMKNVACYDKIKTVFSFVTKDAYLENKEHLLYKHTCVVVVDTEFEFESDNAKLVNLNIAPYLEKYDKEKHFELYESLLKKIFERSKKVSKDINFGQENNTTEPNRIDDICELIKDEESFFYDELVRDFEMLKLIRDINYVVERQKESLHAAKNCHHDFFEVNNSIYPKDFLENVNEKIIDLRIVHKFLRSAFDIYKLLFHDANFINYKTITSQQHLRLVMGSFRHDKCISSFIKSTRVLKTGMTDEDEIFSADEIFDAYSPYRFHKRFSRDILKNAFTYIKLHNIIPAHNNKYLEDLYNRMRNLGEDQEEEFIEIVFSSGMKYSPSIKLSSVKNVTQIYAEKENVRPKKKTRRMVNQVETEFVLAMSKLGKKKN